MTEMVVFLVILALVAYAVERNHARDRYPHPTLSGGSNVEDRDVERTRVELDALGVEHDSVPAPRSAPAHSTRSVHAGAR
jgi:hypothetical protein